MRTLGFLSLAALAAGPAAYAEAPAAANLVVYEPDFFARFAPRTAFDMVSHVPGFSIDGGSGRRGLSGSSGNVRIDGEQPTAKSQSLEDILARIPASDVARIELIRGESSGASGGQTTFVNVVRTPKAGGETIWTLGAITTQSRFGPQAEASISRSIGAGTLSLKGAYLEERGVAKGPRIRRDAAGALIRERFQHTPYLEKETQFSAEWTSPFLGGDFSLTGQAGRALDKEHIFGLTRNAAGLPIENADSKASETTDTIETGFGYSRDFDAWTLGLNGLLTRHNIQQNEIEIGRDGADRFVDSESQNSETDSGETILRTVLSRELGQAKLEFGVEAALNTREQQFALVIDQGAGPQPVTLPSANVRVEEKRAEAFATFTAPLGGWTAEATVAAETSLLSQEGDVNQETELTYWKPSFQFVRAIGANDQLRFRFYRDVGQLSFGDFVAAATLADNTVSAGNPDLKPQTSWRIETAGDWRFGESGALAATLYHRWIEDALDVIPFGPPGARFAAPGNIGKAKVLGASFSLTLPLDGFITGGQFISEGTFQHSEATDPLTGQKRALSGFQEIFARFAFRQDLPDHAFAWGAEYSEPFEVAPGFRLDEVSTGDGDQNWEVFVETTAIDGLKIRAWYLRLPGPAQYRTRYFYRPDRLAAFTGTETVERDPGYGFGITVSGSF